MTTPSSKDGTGGRFGRIGRRCLLAALAVLTACGSKEASFFAPTRLDLSVFTGSVNGTVTVNGQGAAGVTVRSGTRTTVTGSDGTYILTGLPTGANTITIAGVPTIATCSQSSGTATVTAGTTTRLDFPCTAPTTGSVAGTVTINGTGTAGIGITVGTRTASTGAGGTYRVDGITPGSTTVSVATPAGATCSPSARSVQVTAGAVATADFACTAPTTGSVAGTVTVNGTPTGGIGVSAGGQPVTTGGNGAYRIDGLNPGSVLVSLGQVPQGTTCSPSTQQVTVTANVSTANFTCTRPIVGSLSGMVTINGVPAAGMSVTAGGRFATTNSAGVYRIDSLPPGATQASLVELPPNTTCNPGSQSVMIIADAVATANFGCTQPTTGAVAGRVTINGTGAAGITVFSGLASTTTLGDGTYRLEPLLPGIATVGLTGLLSNVTCVPTAHSVLIVAGGTATADFTCTAVPLDFGLGVVPSYRHLGSTSRVCATLTTTPAQPNAAYSGTLTGPGVLTASVQGTLNSSGMAVMRFGIGAFGNYNGVATVGTKTATFSINVTSAAGSCPP